MWNSSRRWRTAITSATASSWNGSAVVSTRSASISKRQTRLFARPARSGSRGAQRAGRRRSPIVTLYPRSPRRQEEGDAELEHRLGTNELVGRLHSRGRLEEWGTPRRSTDRPLAREEPDRGWTAAQRCAIAARDSTAGARGRDDRAAATAGRGVRALLARVEEAADRSWYVRSLRGRSRGPRVQAARPRATLDANPRVDQSGAPTWLQCQHGEGLVPRVPHYDQGRDRRPRARSGSHAPDPVPGRRAARRKERAPA